MSPLGPMGFRLPAAVVASPQHLNIVRVFNVSTADCRPTANAGAGHTRWHHRRNARVYLRLRGVSYLNVACNKVTSQTENPSYWWMLVVLCTWHWWQMDRLRSVVPLVILWTWSVWRGFRCNLLLFSSLVSHLYHDCELSRSLWSLACQSPELLIARWLAEVLMSWWIPRIRMPRWEKPTCHCWVTCGFLGAGIFLNPLAGCIYIYIHKLYHSVMFHISDWHVTSCCLKKIHILWCFIIMIILFIYHTVSLSLDPAVICHGVVDLQDQLSDLFELWVGSKLWIFLMMVGQTVLTSLTSLYKLYFLI